MTTNASHKIKALFPDKSEIKMQWNWFQFAMTFVVDDASTSMKNSNRKFETDQSIEFIRA